MDEIEIGSREKILTLFSKYRVEMVILIVSVLFLVCGIYVYIDAHQGADDIQIESDLGDYPEESNKKTKIIVDLSGSIKRPGVYELNNNSRLKDLLEKAGGLSNDADSKYFERNYNLARILVDQEKIYIPNKADVEELGDLSSIQDNQIDPKIIQEDQNQTNLINVNNATTDQLDSLPGVGKVISGRIISSRPYSSIEELKEKKVVNNSLFEKIKDLIVVN